jgi:hypothetical protein
MRLPSSHDGGDDLATRNSDVGLQRTGQAAAPPRNRLVNIEGRSGGAQGIVVVGSRGAKKRHHGVADVLVDRAAIAIDDAVDQRRETVDQLMNLLGVQRAGKRRESGEIREQDRDLTSLAVRLERRFRRRARSTRASLVYRREQALAMAERAQSEFFKVSIGEMRQDGKINVIFCEGAPVLPQSELIQPVAYLRLPRWGALSLFRFQSFGLSSLGTRFEQRTGVYRPSAESLGPSSPRSLCGVCGSVKNS